jgi:glycosyltransferase involved in cell wall biosynthesis
MSQCHIHWIAVQPTPYNCFLFSEIAKDPEVALTVHFTHQSLASHPWRSSSAGVTGQRYFRQILGLDWTIIREAIRNKSACFVVAGWRELGLVALINCLCLFGRHYVIWTDTPRVRTGRPKWKEYIRAAWLRRVFRHAHAVMGTGRRAVEMLVELGCAPSKVVNFPFVVDLARFSPRHQVPSESTKKHLTFVSVGRLNNSVKAFDRALRALAVARQKTTVTSFTYRIAGTGPDRGALERLALALGIGEQVEFVGWLESAELPGFYRGGDVMLHTALYDPYPVAVLEAMACGLAIISSDAVGETSDRVIDGQNGRVHPAGDIETLADQLVGLLKEPELAAVWGVNARKMAESWPADRSVAIVKGLLQRRRPQCDSQ